MASQLHCLKVPWCEYWPCSYQICTRSNTFVNINYKLKFGEGLNTLKTFINAKKQGINAGRLVFLRGAGGDRLPKLGCKCRKE